MTIRPRMQAPLYKLRGFVGDIAAEDIPVNVTVASWGHATM